MYTSQSAENNKNILYNYFFLDIAFVYKVFLFNHTTTCYTHFKSNSLSHEHNIHKENGAIKAFDNSLLIMMVKKPIVFKSFK